MRKPCFLRTARTSFRLSLQFSFLYAVSVGSRPLPVRTGSPNLNSRIGSWTRCRATRKPWTIIYERDGADAVVQKVDALAQVSFENTRIFQLLTKAGEIVTGNISIPMSHPLPGYIPVEDVEKPSLLHDEVEGYWMREDMIGPFRLVQGSGDHIIGEVLEALATALIVGYLGVIVFGFAVGERVGRLTEQRITQISRTLSLVSQSQLDARVSCARKHNR